MQFLFSHFDTLINVFVSIIVASGFLGTAANLYIHKKNARMDKRQVITEEKVKAISETIDFERSGLNFEILALAHPEFDLNPDPVDKVVNLDSGIRYSVIFESRDSLTYFYSQLCDIRKKNEKYLSLDSAALLWVAEQYYIDLCKLLTALNSMDDHQEGEDYLFIHGLLYTNDYVAWQRKIDDTLVKELKNANELLLSHSGEPWEYAKRNALAFYEKSLLKQSLNNAADYFDNYS